jgi:hypothetical protein
MPIRHQPPAVNAELVYKESYINKKFEDRIGHFYGYGPEGVYIEHDSKFKRFLVIIEMADQSDSGLIVGEKDFPPRPPWEQVEEWAMTCLVSFSASSQFSSNRYWREQNVGSQDQIDSGCCQTD